MGQAGLRAPAMEGEGDEKSAWGGEKGGNKSLVDAEQNLQETWNINLTLYLDNLAEIQPRLQAVCVSPH